MNAARPARAAPWLVLVCAAASLADPLEPAKDAFLVELLNSHAWEITKTAAKESFVVLTVRREVPSRKLEEHWWDYETYTIQLDPQSATLTRE